MEHTRENFEAMSFKADQAGDEDARLESQKEIAASEGDRFTETVTELKQSMRSVLSTDAEGAHRRLAELYESGEVEARGLNEQYQQLERDYYQAIDDFLDASKVSMRTPDNVLTEVKGRMMVADNSKGVEKAQNLAWQAQQHLSDVRAGFNAFKRDKLGMNPESSSAETAEAA